ncbi:hypothetical protein EMA8858_04056 [Emticicia aquatica]|uniref:PqqD family protein n=1 Tax=Emticicia aquatica TaxID=1681835 RepID=A0ABN8F1B9_9BACT|nr:PqqD family protein [Emticicia aquatica]CAH0997921.1 hypothetical protein EMA8858_04056 [Emticicia aquatica]
MKNYSVATLGIAYEHFDDETVIVNLPKGHYYSLGNTAHFIFQLFANGSNATQIANALSSTFDISTAAALEVANDFINQLIQEELLVETNTFVEFQAPEIAVKKTFEEPFLEVFSDMKEMLTLDPVHDVDPKKGWPLKK